MEEMTILETVGMVFVVFCVLDLIILHFVLGYLLREFDKMDEKLHDLSQIVYENEKKYDRDIVKILSKMHKIIEIFGK
jgi:hypothetical protein